MIRSTFGAAVTLSLSIAIVQAAVPSPNPHQEFVCVRGAEQRIVALYTKLNERSSAGCRVEYTKASHTQILWTSQSRRGFCTAKVTQLVTQLAQDKFECRPRTIGAAETDSP